ncbi:hypothetical protein EWI07_05675 [Sporolactobacillus sp. THM7-4]|nr:hypothetical protein EWI07_05675 [Sporolactobacillus sp. THM7-4]
MDPQYIATFDIGTSAVKGLLLGKAGDIVLPDQVNLHTDTTRDFREQDPLEWAETIKLIIRHWRDSGISPAQIAAVTFSGQMQDLICLDKQGKPVAPAILYSDSRADEEAETIGCLFENITETTGNPFDGTTPLAKWLWMKKRHPVPEENTVSLLFGAKDYLIFCLTGRRVIDPTNASTTGLMGLKFSTWIEGWLPSLGLSAGKLPQIVPFDQVAGTVTEKAAGEFGLTEGTSVFCGCGDAGSTSMGAGAFSNDDTYIYLGTTAWAACASENRADKKKGLFQLRYLDQTPYLAIAPLVNGGNVHKWAVEQLASGEYYIFERMVRNSRPGARGLLFLPYLNGARSPVNDSGARGAFIGLSVETMSADMARAVLEGTAYSLKQVLSILPSSGSKQSIRIIGGGTQSAVWCQIIADVFQKRIVVPESAQYLPALGSAAGPFVRLGWQSSYSSYVKNILDMQDSAVYRPDPTLKKGYESGYKKFKSIYPALKEI